MCNALQVSRSGYYAWRANPISNRARQDIDLTEQITCVFNKGWQKYGPKKVREVLVKKGVLISRKRTARLMSEAALTPKLKRKYKVTTDSKHKLYIAPNLLKRQFNIAQPNRVWAGDITCILTRKGWLYLATVMDLHSRKIVGWSMANHMRAELVNDALTMAVWRRKPSKGLVWHSDRGSQYCSKSHRAIIKDHGISQSMSRKGDCWDNATSESFFSTLKRELDGIDDFDNQQQASAAIFEYIEVFYNKIRVHSTIGYVAPEEFERKSNIVKYCVR